MAVLLKKSNLFDSNGLCKLPKISIEYEFHGNIRRAAQELNKIGNIMNSKPLWDYMYLSTMNGTTTRQPIPDACFLMRMAVTRNGH